MKHSQPQLLRSADDPLTISDEMELKIFVLGKLGDGSREGRQRVCLKSAISIRKYQHFAFRGLDASVSRG
ncbi:MAG: hypothetical protein WA211_05645 [Candidatus Acidiferrales bacterium]